MIDWMQILKFAIATVPFFTLTLLTKKANLKKENRSRQFLMPIIALILCVAAMIFITNIYALALRVIERLTGLIGNFIPQIRTLMERLNIGYLAFFAANFLLLSAYLAAKRIIITILGKIFKTGNSLYEQAIHPFYSYDEEENAWFIYRSHAQVRGLFCALYYGTIFICCALMVFGASLFAAGRTTTAVFYPVFAIILVGELYFFLDGLTKEEWKQRTDVEEDDATKHVNYALMRETLRKLFPDKLIAESTKANEVAEEEPLESILARLQQNENPTVSTYAAFMQRYHGKKLPIDRNYMFSAIDMLQGKSVLFNNPFYRDYIPYLFYPMQRVLLRNKKVLLVLGRNGVEDDICSWLKDGLNAVNSTPDLFDVQVLHEGMEALPDIGIIVRSDVHNQKLHEACGPFFDQAEFAVVLEPSKLLTTAQIGLNNIAKRLQKQYTEITWCGIDKNCDGLVDALSHVLLVDLHEVSATERHTGVSSYMLWDADKEHLTHRLLPSISRYLGFGTELSFAALKNQIDKTEWYGGEAFPVTDIHWIAKQYYHDLLSYAELPPTQQEMDERFVAKHNLWNAPISENAYLTVEDENCNMFEMRRAFSTRATKQGFVNILSPEYLLKDYMAENADIFETDAKAIPHIVADYVRSERNVALRLILMMSSGAVREQDLKKELYLLGIDNEEPVSAFWTILCESINPIGTAVTRELILPSKTGFKQVFSPDVIRSKQKYDIDAGKVFTLYYIEDGAFIKSIVTGLQNADCIAEDEKGETHFLGSELRGHIFQKYLPGQLLTLDGKSYEMLTVTPRGQMLVRRAADHINGRESYRQERLYRIHSLRESEQMGATREIGGMKVVRAYADLSVDTPAFWRMEKHNDFSTAKRVALNGIPTRTYCNKQVLRVELPAEGLTDEVRYTITTLFNEALRSVLAENQPYLAVVMPGSEAFGDHPITYSIASDGAELSRNAIYFIEDSQMDLGLLVAVERNLRRIFEMICDYLDWHIEALEKSQNPPPEPETPDFRVNPDAAEEDADEAPKKSKNPFKRLWGAIRSFFKRILEFFKRLFKKKPKQPKAPVAPEDEKSQQAPADSQEEGIDAEGAEQDTDDSEPETSDEETLAEADVEEQSLQKPDIEESDNVQPESTSSIEEIEGNSASNTEILPEEETVHMFFSTASPRYLLEKQPSEDSPEETHTPDETEGVEEESTGGVTTEFEQDKAVKAAEVPSKKPYHERYYLLFGFTELPSSIVPDQALEYLIARGYGESSLKQARKNKNLADLIERGIQSGNGHLCDFCGRPLSGIDHEVLADGRERCSLCSRSAVRSADEFNKILATVLKNLTAFFGVQITKPVHIQVVNAKKLHKKLGKTFVPTGNADGRVLGVAIKDRKGYSILVENGAPRMQTTMTLAHELTHIWQYLNWDQKEIQKLYGKKQELEIYEGMAKWAEIQYAYLVGETNTAKREEAQTMVREDEYGRGFKMYLQCYPLREDFQAMQTTPFQDPKRPL